MLKEAEIILRIVYDPNETIHPGEWDWVEICDMPSKDHIWVASYRMPMADPEVEVT